MNWKKQLCFLKQHLIESSEAFNPAKFCLPFYRSFYTIIFQKYESKRRSRANILIESKVAIEGSREQGVTF